MIDETDKYLNVNVDENKDNKNKEKNDDYIDVAKNAEYQNQSRHYYNEFLNWRSSGNNRYAYYFVRRKSEHSYVDGQGFISKTPEETEQRVLKRCCKLVAMTMFSMLLFTIAEYIYVGRYTKGETLSVTQVMYGQPLEKYDVPLYMCAVICVIRLLKFLIPILIFVLDARIPRAVMFPRADRKMPDMAACALVMSLMATIFCRHAGNISAVVYRALGTNALRMDFLYSHDIMSVALFGFCSCIVVSALTEILFRGLILQTFRQFGDMFAFIICCIAGTFCTFDVSSIGYKFCMNIMITLFTLRTGSIIVAIVMRVSAQLLIFALDLIEIYTRSDLAVLTEGIVCFIIIALSLVIYSRLTASQNFSFNINSSRTHLTLAKKLLIFLSDNMIMLWLIIMVAGGVFMLVSL